MPNLAGLHDIEGAAISPAETWLVDTISLSQNQVPRQYNNDAPGRQIIARLNNGYGDTGTLPHPDDYNDFVLQVIAHVNATSGCHRWIIGNEPNLAREWPYKVPIMPWQYAACYRLCRSAIHALAGHEQDQVLVAASGPWNNELKYAGNLKGDWIQYFVDVITALDGECDGFALHAYCHGYNVALVTSEARMEAPFLNRRYEFRVYLDYLEAIPTELRHLPVYITEANGNGPWQAVGLMPAMLAEINNHNGGGGQPILNVCFFRYPDQDDGYEMVDKPPVIAEYKDAVARNFPSPDTVAVAPPPTPAPAPSPDAGQGQTPVPPTLAPAPPSTIVWDSRLDARGIKITPYNPKPGELYWKIIKGEYLLEKEHIFADTLDRDGKKQAGVQVRRWWGDKKPDQIEVKETRITTDNWMVDFPMWNAGWAYGLEVLGHPSDTLWGMGLGSVEQPTWNIHLSYKFTYQLVLAPAISSGPVAPQPPPKVIVTPSPSGATLAWPCKGTVTERWGGNPAYYQEKLGIPYHNGLDIASALGTTLGAMADGEVAMVGVDASYGNYVRVWHEHLGLHTFFGHMQTVDVAAGQKVKQGQSMGKMGATGLATGPHVHIEVRLGEKLTYAEGTQGMGNGRVDPETVMYVLNRYKPRLGDLLRAPVVLSKDHTLALAIAAAKEFGVDVALFRRLVQEESEWIPDALSPAGAVGLAQIMPATFDEWSVPLGATNILDPNDNLRVGAAYLAFLVKYYKGDYDKAVTAYNMGPGNVDAGVAPSAATQAYVQKVVHNQ